MAYIITVDHVADEGAVPGTNLNAVGRQQGTIASGTVAFRILDDDDILYYEGIVTDDENILDVLDWATWNAGATQMLTSPNGVAWTHVN